MNTNNIININEVNTKQLLIRQERYKVICGVLNVGDKITKHSHPANAYIQVISGTVQVNFYNGDSITLKQGDIFDFDASIEHEVIPKQQSKILVTLIAK